VGQYEILADRCTGKNQPPDLVAINMDEYLTADGGFHPASIR